MHFSGIAMQIVSRVNHLTFAKNINDNSIAECSTASLQSGHCSSNSVWWLGELSNINH
jgi:hypothetical protein